MEGDSPSCFFRFHLLPLHLQESILSLLPVSTLIVCTNVSRFFRSLIRSQSFISSYGNRSKSQPIFLCYGFFPRPHDTYHSVADAYDPLLHRWFPFPLPNDNYSIHVSSASLLFSMPPQRYAGFLLSDPFSTSSAIQIPPLKKTRDYMGYWPLAIISQTPSGGDGFKMVMVSNEHRKIRSQVYDSRTHKWAMKGVLDGVYSVVGNGVFLDDDGLLYCLTHGPDRYRLLTYDPVEGKWEVVKVDLPAGRGSYLVVFDGRLFLVGGREELGVMAGIGIWEMDWVRMEWRIHCWMPDDVFVELCEVGSNYFKVADRKGTICFLGSKRPSSILMCDLEAKRWWWPPRPRDFKRRCFKKGYCCVQVVEPYIDLVKARR